MGKRIFGILMALFLAVMIIDVPAEAAAVKYKITYELNKGTNNPGNPATYKSTQKVTLKDPTRKGYTFVGWYRDKGFTKQVTRIKKGTTGNKKFYARWKANKYTIVFDGNGATSGTMANMKNLKYYKQYTLTANAFKKKNCKFLGWNTKADGTGKSYANKEEVKGLTYKNGKKVTLYAQWLRVVNSTDFAIKPNDGKDDTEGINDALYEAGEIAAERGGKVRVTLPKGTYNVTVDDNSTYAIKMRSNVELKLADGAVIKVKKQGVKQCCGVICFFNVKNAQVSGGKVLCQNPSSPEDIYGVWVKSSKDVTIYNMEITGSQCDGVYLSPQQIDASSSIGNNGVTINKCKIHDNNRNNITITDADNVTITGCQIYNTGNRGPNAGICIEPNKDISGDKKCKNILVKNTTIKSGRNVNDWRYPTLLINNESAFGGIVAENVRFEKCTLIGYYSNYAGGKNVTVSKDSKVTGGFLNLLVK